MANSLSPGVPERGDRVGAAFDAVYNWSYDSELEELRRLYLKGLDLQWIAERELPWDQEIDREAFARTFTIGALPVAETSFWRNLAPDKRWEIARRGTAFSLSNFLHGEQGALMVASQLVNAVPHMDGKFYAATQTLDEARHVEVFARYIAKLDHVYPIAPSLKELLDKTLMVDGWMLKAVGMQIVVEGLALYTFRDMRENTAEPLLKQLLTYVSRDEARHTAFGIKYLSNMVPTLEPKQIAELEDFAFEATRMLLDSRRGATLNSAFMQMLVEAGVDLNELAASMQQDRAKQAQAIAKRGGRLGPISGFVVPTLNRIGLLSPRIAGHFREMFDALSISVPPTAIGAPSLNPLDALVELPEDLDAWVAGT